MRMWMVNPKIMCRRHLLGEHLELHMFIGTINKGKKIDGYLKNNLLEPSSLIVRHEKLKDEMIRRGYNHNSKIKLIDDNKFLSDSEYFTFIDKEKSKGDLLKRCKECSELNKRYEIENVVEIVVRK